MTRAWLVMTGLAFTVLVFGCGGDDASSRGRIVGEVDTAHRVLRSYFRVEGETVAAVVDTGCAHGFVVTHRAGKELGIPVSEIPKGKSASVAPPDKIEFAGVSSELRLWILPEGGVDEFLARRGAQGFVGWGLLKQTVLEIDWDGGWVRIHDELPSEVGKWESWEISSDPAPPMLIVEASISGDERARLLLDTGSNGGLTLWHARWDKLFGRSELPKTICGSRSAVGFDAQPEVLAESLCIGNVVMRSLPVHRTTDPRNARARIDGLMGLVLLSQLRIFVDGKNGKVYVRPRAGRESWPHHYNRLGACFLPAESDPTILLAHVVEGTPAYRAGIRGGDRLKSIAGRSVDELLREEGAVTLNHRWNASAGTRYGMALERDGRLFGVEVELEDVLRNPSEPVPPTKG